MFCEVEVSSDLRAGNNVEERRFSPGGRIPRPSRLFPQAAFVLALLALMVVLPLVARAQRAPSANPTADLPAGPMQSKATAACLECHEARIILQQRLSKAAWTKEVDKMTKWGAVVDPADRDALIDYLSANFSPEKPAYEPTRTSGAKSISGKTSKK
jgi:hypothetical protein